jgi:hypothetical protein
LPIGIESAPGSDLLSGMILTIALICITEPVLAVITVDEPRRRFLRSA